MKVKNFVNNLLSEATAGVVPQDEVLKDKLKTLQPFLNDFMSSVELGQKSNRILFFLLRTLQRMDTITARGFINMLTKIVMKYNAKLYNK